jgi:hypothetical protein
LDHNQERIRSAFDTPPRGVVVHRHGGRDRTGALIALALSVPDEPIAEITPMLNTLLHVRAMSGTTGSHLLAIGVTSNRITAVRDRLRGTAIVER